MNAALEATIERVRRTPLGARIPEAVTRLAARYHDEAAPDGRLHRLVILAHPLPRDAAEEKETPCP